MSKLSEEQLQSNTVRISSANKDTKDTHEGTGFFVTSNLILTCAHVVENARENALSLKLNCQGWETSDVTICDYTNPDYPDLALLKVDVNHASALALDDSIEQHDKVSIYGYPEQMPNGDSGTLIYEGESHKPLLYKFKEGQIIPGFSGSPVLNERTGLVCAMIVSTRDKRSALGGRAIPVSVILQHFPTLISNNKKSIKFVSEPVNDNISSALNEIITWTKDENHD